MGIGGNGGGGGNDTCPWDPMGDCKSRGGASGAPCGYCISGSVPMIGGAMVVEGRMGGGGGNPTAVGG